MNTNLPILGVLEKDGDGVPQLPEVKGKGEDVEETQTCFHCHDILPAKDWDFHQKNTCPVLRAIRLSIAGRPKDIANAS